MRFPFAFRQYPPLLCGFTRAPENHLSFHWEWQAKIVWKRSGTFHPCRDLYQCICKTLARMYMCILLGINDTFKYNTILFQIHTTQIVCKTHLVVLSPLKLVLMYLFSPNKTLTLNSIVCIKVLTKKYNNICSRYRLIICYLKTLMCLTSETRKHRYFSPEGVTCDHKSHTQL